MSFMFNPYPFDDNRAVNRPDYVPETTDLLVEGTLEVCSTITQQISELAAGSEKPVVIGMDGYATAEFDSLLHVIERVLHTSGIASESISVATCLKSPEELDKLVSKSLPRDQEIDPILLFGKLYQGSAETYFDSEKVVALKARIAEGRTAKVVIVHGSLSAVSLLRPLYELTYYMDIIPKEVVLRYKHGQMENIGDKTPKTYRELMRRAYYCDFELCMELRTELMQNDLIDYYITGTKKESMQLLSFSLLKKLCDSQVRRPFRCKPVYNEGVWGGHYTKTYRELPSEMSNCAWVFDLIPSEVSLLMEVGSSLVDIPFYTFIRMQSRSLLGEKSINQFGEYFPIRFNYDDTMHSSGNMSIQVHPGEDYCKTNFGELGRQDESYYIVATGLGAKTYCGFTEDTDAEEFFEYIKDSEKNQTPIDYQKFVHAVPTVPGMQILLPSGTIHSSGQNQLVLEIGSLTIGSYTFKLYDYLRKDLDGTTRPIHSIHGENVLRTDWKASWVEENLVQQPKVLHQEGDASELEIGKHDLLYFTSRRLDFQTSIAQDTEDSFHVLALVDGEKVQVVSESDPNLYFVMNYLDIIVVPACVGAYRIENLGNQPVSVHKTLLV